MRSLLRHIFVVSLGNPAPYESTLHSAGHIVLTSLQQKGLLEQPQPPFTKQKFGNKNALSSVSRTHTLLQSPTQMNISGQFVGRAWKDHAQPQSDGLVVVADDLEEKLGTVKIREWGSSARGHNGIKSCQDKMKRQKQNDARWARISVGIGRPEGRDHGTVSDYVLGPMPSVAKVSLTEKAPVLVAEKLKELERKWGGFAKEEETTTEYESDGAQ